MDGSTSRALGFSSMIFGSSALSQARGFVAAYRLTYGVRSGREPPPWVSVQATMLLRKPKVIAVIRESRA